MNEPAAQHDIDRIAAVADPHFDRVLAAGTCPGIAYAVMAHGAVVHARGIGSRSVQIAAVPDGHTGFRIASMTKSFTAATVLSLRDDGLLSLDDHAVRWVPELAAGGSAAEEITLRHLMTMGAGFATDDPWGDRQQDLAIEAFRALLAKGIAPVMAPGDRFEYSNTGFAILGLVISAVTGLPYTEAVRTRVLEPLGMTETGFTTADVPVMASGYVKRSDGWQEEPVAAPGAFSPMGGLISTVEDLVTWVGHLQRGDGAPIMTAASAREMQRTQRLVSASTGPDPDEAAGEPLDQPHDGPPGQRAAQSPPGQPPRQPPHVSGYGFGLFEDLRPWGRSVHHSGGYPGFGSHMRWHPASGLAVVALANGTYAPMSTAATAALGDLVQELRCETASPLPPVPGLDRAVAAVDRWLRAPDPDGPEGRALVALWADNVERDLPWAERLTGLQALRQQFGALSEVPGSRRRVEAGTVTWDLSGEHGGTGPSDVPQVVRVVVMVAPHDTDLVQSVTLRAVKAVPPPPSVELS